MEAVIVFFRDILSGTLYIVVSIVCFILILICLLLLIKRSKRLRVKVEEYEQSHIVIINAKGEEETIEIGKSSANFNLSSNGVANMSATASINGVPKSVVSNNSMVNSTVPPVSKPVVTINPLEVASVSSTMNLIGSSNVQKNAVSLVNNEISNKIENTSDVTVINSESIASTVGTTSVIDPESIASTVGTTKLIDPEDISNSVGVTNVFDANISGNTENVNVETEKINADVVTQ